VAAKDKPGNPSEGTPDEAKVEQDAAEAKQAEGQEQAAEQAEAAEPKKPRRRRRKKADDTPAADAKAADAKADDAPAADAKADAPDASSDADDAKEAAAVDDAEAEAAEAEGEPEAEDADGTPADEEKPKRRRGAAEVTAGRKREKAAPAPRGADGAVAVRARAKYVRTAPRKARLVIDHIRGKSVDQARAILINTPRAASRDVLKLLDSAIANAENNHELVADELVVGQAFVDEGPTLKRYRPRALGRATRIRKRTSHMTITLTTNDRNGR
jgi:ribosomal protein L22